MQMNEYKYIEDLLERFFEGETSNAEEQELYQFFARPDLPEHLKPYQPVFGYFETGIVREVSGTETVKPARKAPFVKRYLFAGIAIAASLLLLFVLNNRTDKAEDDFNPYAGSYIIRNGVRTEIPEEVAREIDKVVQQAEKHKYDKEQMAFQTLRQHKQEAEKLKKKEMDVEKLKEQIDQIEKRYTNK